VSVLDLWGLDEESEALYRALLRNPGRDAAWFARHLERREDDVSQDLTALIGAGLVVAQNGGYAAGAPATTLYPLVNAELADLDGRRARLDAVRASLASFAADHVVGRSRNWAQAPFELLSATESFVAVEDLTRSTRGEVVATHLVTTVGVDAPAYTELLRRQLAAGRPMRGLYPSDVVQDPERLGYVRHWAAAGEQVRLLPRVPPPISVFGDEVAVISSTWDDGPSDGRILVRAPALVAMVKELFDHYWGRAAPLRGAALGSAEPDERHEILQALMQGHKDEAIARQLGVSLRTVRRRVADLMAELGASTRFQAGMEAVRRGLL
jgi:DNA-binding CsgD family transcriptional regulator